MKIMKRLLVFTMKFLKDKNNMRNLLIIVLMIASQAVCLGQNIETDWHFSEITNNQGDPIIEIDTENDILQLSNGTFQYQIASKNNVLSSGDYILQNKLLVFFYSRPNDTIRRYRITETTDSTLVFTENNISYAFQKKKETLSIIENKEEIKTDIITPSEGFSFTSLWRGVLGMFSLLFISFLFSSNRRAINWKTVGIGLTIQLIIAIGVLKISFIQNTFEFVGKIFVKILEFTQAGSKFLFEGLVIDMDTFGFIFAFQVLPTIIFFSALTSVLFYLGIIQKVVKAFGWLLSKLLKISGAESLSVAGNIFLGQTEAPLLIKAYLEKMNKSEMLLVMIGGMATVAGAVLAAYIG
ncbi:MAG: CNT family concentrative nucleoside transporter, partial [Psychroserpens sp.]